MDPLARHHFELVFELEFRKARGDVFQIFFGRIMNMRYPGDFVQTRPWGKLGDEKCDGYLPSLRRFYQCYAPNEVRKPVTLKKLNDDFLGALPHAAEFFDAWVFTHNCEDGRMPAWLGLELQRLREEHSTIEVAQLGFVELRLVVFELDDGDLISLLGPPVTQRAMASLGLQELKPILAHLEQVAPQTDESPRPVPPEKLAYNALPLSVEALLKAGMTKASLVNKYFNRTQNKELGDNIAASSKHEYERLRNENLSGVEIFDRLWTFASGPYRGQSGGEVAALAVLAYLFEACDIFETP